MGFEAVAVLLVVLLKKSLAPGFISCQKSTREPPTPATSGAPPRNLLAMMPRRPERPPVLLVFDQALPEPLSLAALSPGAPYAAAQSPAAQSPAAPSPEELSSAPVPFVYISADRYLEGEGPSLAEGATVVNLCRSYAYLSRGYYVSLVAEARNQRALPPLAAAEDAGDPFTYFRALQEAGVRTVGYRLQPGRRLLPKRVALGEGTARLLEGGEGESGDDTRLRLAEPAGPWLDVTSALGYVRDRRFRRFRDRLT